MPYNAYDHCSTFTVAEGGFATVVSTQTHDLGGGNSVDVFPTVVSEHHPFVSVQLNLISIEELNLRVISMLGQTLRSENHLVQHEQTLQLSLSDLPIGTYILHLSTDKGNLSQILIKQ